MIVWGTRGEAETVARPLERMRHLAVHNAGIRMEHKTTAEEGRGGERPRGVQVRVCVLGPLEVQRYFLVLLFLVCAHLPCRVLVACNGMSLLDVNTLPFELTGYSENIGKDYFRLGNEVDFRGNKSLYVDLSRPPPPAILTLTTPSAHGGIGAALTPSWSRR